jgi:starch synthase
VRSEQEGFPIRILLAASEVVGFAKTGGLADVAGSLPAALAQRGHDCAVLMPLYAAVRRSGISLKTTDHSFRVSVGKEQVQGRLWRSTLPGSTVPVWLIEQPAYFERDDPALGRGLYQYSLPDGSWADYPDNCARFVFFSRAVLEAIRVLDWWPDVLHLNDWQTGLVPVYLREEYERTSLPAEGDAYRRIRTLFTVHNIAYQGLFWHWDMDLAGLDWRLFNLHQLEFHGKLSFLKAGLVFADYLNTVSPTYAREIQTPYFGCGLHGLLAARRERLFGIMNGADYRAWNPATDPHLAARYTPEDPLPGKARCKAALQARCKLPGEPHAPLLGVVARLVEQKGIDLICQAMPDLLKQQPRPQLVLLGDGDATYRAMLQELSAAFPRQVSMTFRFDESLAHQIEAGADLFLMPSLYEPAGLNQLYSMKYGTPPVVRATGGLADTVVDTTPDTLANATATGFRFIPATPAAFREAVQAALTLHRTRPEAWLQVMRTGMRQDWSWDRSATAYERLYQMMVPH